MNPEWLNALLGGVLIGIAASLMLLWNGQVAGVSGILGRLITSKPTGWNWPLAFVLGLIVGGFILKIFVPDVFFNSLALPAIVIVVAGLLVGFGTAMGSGCTSGHGVCGISRLSVRSIVATLIFILAGILSVAGFKALVAYL